MALVRHVAFIQLLWNMTFHGLIEHGQSYSHTIFAHLMVNIYIPWVSYSHTIFAHLMVNIYIPWVTLYFFYFVHGIISLFLELYNIPLYILTNYNAIHGKDMASDLHL
jgi:uncharacterized membrane protein